MSIFLLTGLIIINALHFLCCALFNALLSTPVNCKELHKAIANNKTESRKE